MWMNEHLGLVVLALVLALLFYRHRLSKRERGQIVQLAEQTFPTAKAFLQTCSRETVVWRRPLKRKDLKLRAYHESEVYSPAAPRPDSIDVRIVLIYENGRQTAVTYQNLGLSRDTSNDVNEGSERDARTYQQLSPKLGEVLAGVEEPVAFVGVYYVYLYHEFSGRDKYQATLLTVPPRETLLAWLGGYEPVGATTI